MTKGIKMDKIIVAVEGLVDGHETTYEVDHGLEVGDIVTLPMPSRDDYSKITRRMYVITSIVCGE